MAITILNPANESLIIVSGEPPATTLRWSENDLQFYLFDVVLAEDEDFLSLINVNNVSYDVDNNQYYSVVDGLDFGGDYFWKVKGYNNESNNIDWSVVDTFQYGTDFILSVIHNTVGSLKLKWSGYSSSVNNFEIMKNTGSGWSTIDTIAYEADPDLKVYVDNNINVGTYKYKLKINYNDARQGTDYYTNTYSYDVTAIDMGVSDGGGLIIRLGDTSSHGGHVITSCTRVYAEGKLVSRLTDLHKCPKKHHHTTEIVTASIDTYAEGLRVAREGDKAGCGASLISGALKTFVNH